MFKALFLCLPVLLSGSLSAAPIDLSTWSPLTLNFAGGQPSGNWQLQPGNTTVIQTVNADPSFFLNNLSQTHFSIDGTWRVRTSADDDYMGFVFGYQNSANFYLFDWKQGSQNYVGRDATEGMSIKKLTGATGNGQVDLSLEELWENEVNFGDLTILAKNHGNTKGWADNTLYNFHLDFDLNPGEFHIVVSQGATTLWDTTVTDSTFTGGQFGFYNYSQEAVEYAGFVQTGGVPDSGYAGILLGVGATLVFAAKHGAVKA